MENNINKYRNFEESRQEEESGINIRDILDFFWRLRWWIAGAMAVALVLAVLFVRMQTPMFQRSTWIMLNRNDGANTEFTILSEFTGRTLNKRIDNEVFILKSPSLMSKVVEDLGLNTRYYHYILPIANSKIKHTRSIFARKLAEYYGDQPFTMNVVHDPLYPDAMHPASIYVEFKHEGESGFKIRKMLVNGKKFDPGREQFSYNDSLSLGGFSLTFHVENPEDMIKGDKYIATWNTPFNTAKGFLGGLSVDVQGKSANQSDVVMITMEDAFPRRAEDILNALVARTNREARDYKNLSTLNTIEFIDSRLKEISDQLGNAEINYKNYQSSKVIVDPGSQTSMTLNRDMEYQKQLTEVQLQLQVLDMITNYLNETPENVYKVIPTNIGVSDAGLNSIISNYNSLVAERNRMISNSSENNPRVLSMNTQLEDGKKGIELSVNNLVKIYTIRQRELEKLLSSSKSKIATIPQQQFELQQLSRKMEIIEPLFLLLQQKREETQITMYGEADNFRVIEPAFGPGAPVKPNSKMFYLLALILGFILPPGVVWLRSQLRTRVETKSDVEAVVDAAVLAVLPKSGEADYMLIPKSGRDALSESFRMLRANIQYLPNTKVLQVTSSVPGEGKSFVAANIALSLAHTGKKVVLVGMDLRKPVLPKIFKDVQHDKMASVVGYMIGKVTSIDDMIFQSGVSSSLDLVFAGPVPPNPTELLAQGRQAEIIAALKDRYDYVVIDTAPYLPVADSSLINPLVDATLYVIRADYTQLRMLREIEAVINSKTAPIRNINLVLNDFNITANKYRYGYGEGYGYGYGGSYGYGYGYG
ncbi:MAG: polysaccharide biosynthesis tyrosine autokinase, partial [Bacteroidales bacterium]|nr:polysaccharide biosynthesis tyrosine autokinase [Bacteroidales bacterium]